MPIDNTVTEKHGAGEPGATSRAPAVLLPVTATAGPLSAIGALAEIPEEDIWLAKQKSKRTRRAYKQDVGHFMRTLNIRSYQELRQVDHRAVIAWERTMRERDNAASSTIRRRLAALSSLMKHLVRHGHLSKNHVAEVERPNINRAEGSTLAFSQMQARKLLDHPPADTLEGLRDRAILSVGLQVGLRRAEIAALKVGDLHQNRVYDYVRFLREISEIVELNPLLTTPIRDVNDIIVMQTAIIGESDMLCTNDDDFFEEAARPFLNRLGIVVLDDISLIHRLRS